MRETARRLLEKAKRALNAAQILLGSGEHEFATGRTYYAMFYTARAVLEERGFSAKKHGSVHGIFGQEFAKTGLLDAKYHRWLLDGFDTRIESDYGLEVGVSEEAARDLLAKAEEFLETDREFLTLG